VEGFACRADIERRNVAKIFEQKGQKKGGKGLDNIRENLKLIST